MKHHFGDFLDRDDDYWTIVPNADRYCFRIGDVRPGSKQARIVTLGKGDRDWRNVFTLPKLEELTLHEPAHEQLDAIGVLGTVKRLRITLARPRNLDFIRPMAAVEELVLEYVSGFTDLSPLRDLRRLRSLYIENLRRVTRFDGLATISSLRYLAIRGTLDWNQPIADFEFLRGLPGLEVLDLWQIINKAPYPALLPAASLKKLRKLRLYLRYLATKEYALLEECLPGVAGADWGPYTRVVKATIPLPRDDPRARLSDKVLKAKHPEVTVCYDGSRVIADPRAEWFELTGKDASRFKCLSRGADQRCAAAATRYAALRAQARKLVGKRR